VWPISSLVFILSCDQNVCVFMSVKFKEAVNIFSGEIKRMTGKILERKLKY
jgi:hypothetical protein